MPCVSSTAGDIEVAADIAIKRYQDPEVNHGQAAEVPGVPGSAAGAAFERCQ